MTVFEPTIQRVHRETLKSISKDLLSRYSLQELREILNDSLIQGYLGYTIEKDSDLLNLLIDLSKWKNEYFFLSLLDFLCDSRLFGNDKEEADKVVDHYLSLLKREGFDRGHGRWWIVPHQKQVRFGDDTYRNSSGEVYGEDFILPEDNPVKSITFIRLNGRNTSFAFYINDEYLKIGIIKASSKRLFRFIEISNSETLSTNFDKTLLDYVNYDKRNVIYKNSNCDTTAILVRYGDRMTINEAIKVKFIDQSRYKATLSRLQN